MTIDPKTAARDLVLNRHRERELLGKTLDLTDEEHDTLDRIGDEIVELRHIVRKAVEGLTGVTWDELADAL